MTALPPPPEGIMLAHFIASNDVERSRRFYTEVLGGRVAFHGDVTYVALAKRGDLVAIAAGACEPGCAQ
jgi:catechol 2,3-dioxygenase-like lactoylglutathione lyase family enzyme